MKDQKADVPMAGDMAVIVHSENFKEVIGLTVKVLSDPFLSHCRDVVSGKIRSAICNHIDSPEYSRLIDLAPYRTKGARTVHKTAYLLRIPPDEEAKQLFAEKEESKPKRVKA